MINRYLSFHAQRRPNSLAALRNGVFVSYCELETHVVRLACGLREVGLEAGQGVELAVQDLFTFFVLALALDRMGCAIAAGAPGQVSELQGLPGVIDWLICEQAVPGAAHVRQHLLTKQWLQMVSAKEGASFEPVDFAQEAPLHLRATSGTTGTPKCHVLTRAMMIERINSRRWLYGLTRESRYLVGMPLTIGSVYITALTCVQVGAAVVFENRPLIESGVLATISHVSMLPLHLRQLLDALPGDFKRPRGLAVICIGAPLPDALAARARRLLADDVVNVYGANETGSMASVDAHGQGLVLPGVALRIVDDEGHPLAPGHVGRIAVRTPGMAMSYLGEAAASGANFSDGWFYPGDLGILHVSGQLEVVGRADGLLNVGGQKVLPAPLEARLQELTGARDVAVCTIVGAGGIGQLAVVVEAFSGNHDDLVKRIATAVDPSYGAIAVVQVESIPRTGPGKVARLELQRMVTALMDRAPAHTGFRK